MSSDVVIGMAGSGGDGIVSAGDAMMTAAALEGYSALLTKSFGPQIRGGESSCRVRLATEPVLSSGGTLDFAVALNWDDFLKFGAELPVDGRTTVVYDAATGVAPEKLPLPGVVPREAIAVPIAQMAKATAGTERAKNSVVMGLLAGWLGMEQEAFLAGIRKRFGKKSPEVVKGNEDAFAAGVGYAREHPLREPRTLAPAGKSRSSRAASSSAATRSRPPPRSCTSSGARCGSTAAPCCRPRTRSPASAPWWVRLSPARRR